jgi:hypothetical protein
LVLQLVASEDSLLLSPGSPATSPGFRQTLALVLVKHNSGYKESKTQMHSIISINQSNELSTSSGEQDACNNFMI